MQIQTKVIGDMIQTAEFLQFLLRLSRMDHQENYNSRTEITRMRK